MKLTPRKFKSQLDVHAYIQQNSESSKPAEAGFIDQLKGW